MGIYIYLDAGLENIEEDDWQSAYKESIHILQAFPCPLWRLTAKEIRGVKRYEYTHEIIKHEGTENEDWSVSGDFKTRRHAETFALGRQRNKNASSFELKNKLNPETPAKKADAKDIIWMDVPGKECRAESRFAGGGIGLFGAKTQGEPYHFAILAVGILMESRFPGRSYVYGDISEWEAGEIVPWLNAILKKPVEKPIVFRARDLWERLEAINPDKNKIMDRFEYMYRGSPDDAERVFAEFCESEYLEQKFINELEYYDKLEQFGATRLIVDRLNATEKNGNAEVKPEEKTDGVMESDRKMRSIFRFHEMFNNEKPLEYENAKELAETTGAALGNAGKKFGMFKLLEENRHPREYWLDKIHEQSFHRGVILTEDAWKSIHEEQNSEILQALLAFLCCDKYELSFCEWRIHLLEHPELWPHFLKAWRGTRGRHDAFA